MRIKLLEDEKKSLFTFSRAFSSLLPKTKSEEKATSSMNTREENEKILDSGFKLDAKTPCFKSGSGKDE